jgi:hypothetical protein
MNYAKWYDKYWWVNPLYWGNIPYQYSDKTEEYLQNIMYNPEETKKFLRDRYNSLNRCGLLHFIDISSWTQKSTKGAATLWLGNYPYAYGTYVGDNVTTRGKRSTVIQLKRFIDQIEINYPEYSL